MIKQNLHTHTYYCDGRNSIDEMIQEAIQKGFTVLGFSGHGHCLVDDYSMDEEKTKRYLQDIKEAKEKYKDQIQIFLGLEQDVLGEPAIKGKPYDYLIGSVHFTKGNDRYIAVDESKEMTDRLVEEHHNFLAYAKAYYQEVKKIADMDQIDIVGHVDLLMKFNETESYLPFEDPAYLAIASDCIDRLIEKGKIFEVNTGAIARGIRTTPYPHASLLKYICKQNGKILLNSDCHQKEMLDCHYHEALEMIRSCGFTKMEVLTEHGFVSVSLDRFM